MLAALLLLAAAACAQDAARVSDLAAGRLLIAQRDLRDPNFAETVVFLVEYSKNSALGLVVNRPGELPVSRVFRENPKARDRDDSAMYGGPVQPGAILGLVRANAAFADARQVIPGVWFATSKQAFEKAVEEKPSPDQFRVYLGYSGWGAGQLDGEVRAGAWKLLNGSAAIVFDPDPEGVWDKLMKRSEMRVARGLFFTGRNSFSR